ncbi:MAG: DAK2 domain-containing protein [Chloroflexi bacterium]|jgi:DAK2 domain fusion protein YloV|nr:DAK2 domain-containing protein [Chloroflexota bacterium]
MNPDVQARMERLKLTPIDGQALKKLVEAGLTWLRANQQMVNALNVFPVPDGDTGTNMVLTMQSAYNEIDDLGYRGIGQMAAAVSQGALMGARGNSGVILSQLWRGFARALHNKEILDGPALVHALAEARDTAYKGVVRPVEGTILTVAKDAAAAAAKAIQETDDPSEILARVVIEADASVQRTPDLLPVLKQAGVVDSGGKGLYFILEGMLRFVHGEPLDTPTATVQPLSAMNLENTMDSIEPGQDYEVVVDFVPRETLDLQKFYGELEKIGTSIQMGEGEGMYRMHIHVPTEKRYEPIDFVMSLGTITKIAMENLLAQMEGINHKSSGARVELAKVEPGKIAVVVVSPGAGISRVFASLGVAAIVEGGQSMNPSTKDILDAFENLPTDKVIILPNNKNIILAAQQAKDVTVKKVYVVPSCSIPQGLAAMMQLNPDGEPEAVAAKMSKAIEDVTTIEVTTATRTVEIDGVSVEQGQVIALVNGKLAISVASVEEACLGALAHAHADDYELITLFHGEGLPTSETNRIVDVIRAAYPAQEIELQDGGQSHYQFIISIE